MFSLRHLIEKQELVNNLKHCSVSVYIETDAIVIVLMPPGRKEVPCSPAAPVVRLPVNYSRELDLA